MRGGRGREGDREIKRDTEILITRHLLHTMPTYFCFKQDTCVCCVFFNALMFKMA